MGAVFVENYRGWEIYQTGVNYYATKSGEATLSFYWTLPEMHTAIDLAESSSGEGSIINGDGVKMDGNGLITSPDEFDPTFKNWVGFPLRKSQLSDKGKTVTFGLAPQGLFSDIEAAMLLLLIKKFSSTPDGIKAIRDVAVKYLETVGILSKALHTSSGAHVINCCINGYLACTIYQRLGLISPHDAIQTRAWLDHQIGEAIATERLGFSLKGLESITEGITEAYSAGK